jgi:DNA mismatch endonuclease (patch repair protein)
VRACLEPIVKALVSPPATTAHVRAVMRGNRAHDTTPELIVRRLVRSLGHHYRLHRKDLPGTPDIVFSSKQKAIFVHGCFWHQHSRCDLRRPLKSNLRYWAVKLARNKVRDQRDRRRLRHRGWETLVIWECQLHDAAGVEGRIRAFLAE